ncbi:hypothetical protein FMN50_07775 [Rhodobacterales bacterium]|nr:hypothetical protein FMN50_07775 [Rhodobacterales bacterium]
MRISARSLTLVAALAFTCPVGPAEAQRFLDEQSFRCLENEVEVWGESDRKTFFRNESARLRIDSGEPVVWFCGRKRSEFNCHRNANLVDVSWNPRGQVLFQCMRR